MEFNLYHFVEDFGFKQYKEIECLDSISVDEHVWIDIETNSEEEFQPIAEKYKLHELAIEDCFTRGHFPKLEEFPKNLFIMLRGLKSQQEIEELYVQDDYEEEYNSEKLTRSVAMFISDRYVITHRMSEVSWMDAVVRQIQQQPHLLDTFNPRQIAMRIMEILTLRFQRGINYFEDQIDKLEDQAIIAQSSFEISELLDLKRDLNILMSITRDQKAVFTALANDATLIPSKQLRRYFKNVDERTSTILQGLQRLIDNIASVRDVYFTMTNVRLGDIMRVLAVITTIAAPLHLLVGLYGMNFEAIPLLHDRNGFYLILLLMLSLVLLMLYFFRKKRWI